MRSLPQVLLFATVLFLPAIDAAAQTGVGVELDDVTDNRIADEMLRGSLQVRVKVTGSGLDKASGARVIVKEARDDRGNSVTESSSSPPDFTPREYNSGTLELSLVQPARAASSVKVKGVVELYAPARDPNAIVKIDKALSKLDVPFTAKALKTAKLEITPLSRAGYVAAMKAKKITDKDIEQIRAEGKAHGASEKEIEQVIGMAKALEELDAEPGETSVLLSGKKSDFDRIYRIEILGADGKPVNIPSRSTSSRGEFSVMSLDPSENVAATSMLELFVITDKSKMSFPFELTVPLP